MDNLWNIFLLFTSISGQTYAKKIILPVSTKHYAIFSVMYLCTITGTLHGAIN